jgi:hypothetical protein
MEKRISQETFDGVVKENVEEFDMPLKEAIADAVQQFLSQGVNLESIDTTGGVGKAELDAAIEGVKAFAASKSGGEAAVVAQLELLSALCDDKNEFSKRNTAAVLSSGCYNSLHTLMDSRCSSALLVANLSLIATVCKTSGVFHGLCHKFSLFLLLFVVLVLQ